MSTTAKEQELPKQYHHAGPEQRWYRLWGGARLFS